MPVRHLGRGGEGTQGAVPQPGAGTAVWPFRELLAEITQQYNRTPSGGDQNLPPGLSQERPAVCGLEGCGPPRDMCAGTQRQAGEDRPGRMSKGGGGIRLENCCLKKMEKADFWMSEIVRKMTFHTC